MATNKKAVVANADEVIFALDIGTRTVVGIVGFYEKEIFKVVAAEVYEHQSRAMLDGQIHDIDKVAEVVTEVKNRLEKSLGFSLKKVAIAAAGRVLKTSQTKIEYEIEQGREITNELIGSLEVDAIQQAQQKLDEDTPSEDRIPFYCVGYSVVNYYLNGYVISALAGHKGKKIGVEVLATFLPHIVVDSLYTVMTKVGLEVISLTLEPIAAISVTIPKDLRLLNLVLVDIGAGTSDIAITKDGTVVAYGMVPIAGDEITEKIAQELLLDFNSAEKIKILISSGAEKVKFTNILGKKSEMSSSELLELIQDAIEFLAKSISEKILEFNQKAPNAVFLIGGGSQIPGLTEQIAMGLEMQKDRVAVRGREVIRNIKTKIRKLTGPESITPFGIAMMAYVQKGQDFMSVTVNGEKVRLFNSKKLFVADSLILVGFNPDKLIGRSGKALKFRLNGEQVIVKGEYGLAAEIFVNNVPANLETSIQIGDDIRVIPASMGKSASKYVKDLVNSHSTTVFYEGSEIKLETLVTVNGVKADYSKQIEDGDYIEIKEQYTFAQLIQKLGLDISNSDILINGYNVSLDYVLNNADILTVTKNDLLKQNDPITKNDLLIENSITKNNSLIQKDSIDQQTMVEEYEGEKFESQNEFLIIVNGNKVVLDSSKSYIFVDIFNYIDFDLTSPKGNIVLKLNGKPANFADSIRHNDLIDIYWDNFKA